MLGAFVVLALNLAFLKASGHLDFTWTTTVIYLVAASIGLYVGHLLLGER